MGNGCLKTSIQAKVSEECTIQISLPKQVQFKQEDVNKRTIMMNLLQREVECYKKQNELGFQMIESAKDRIQCQKEEAQKNQNNVDYENYLKEVEKEKEELYNQVLINIQRDIQLQKDKNQEIIESKKSQFNIQEPQDEIQFIENLSKELQKVYDKVAFDMNDLEKTNSVIVSIRQNEEMMLQNIEEIHYKIRSLDREMDMLQSQIQFFRNQPQEDQQKINRDTSLKQKINENPKEKQKSSARPISSAKPTSREKYKTSEIQIQKSSMPPPVQRTSQYVSSKVVVQYSEPVQNSQNKLQQKRSAQVIEENEHPEEEKNVSRKSKLISFSSVSKY